MKDQLHGMPTKKSPLIYVESEFVVLVPGPFNKSWSNVPVSISHKLQNTNTGLEHDLSRCLFANVDNLIVLLKTYSKLSFKPLNVYDLVFNPESLELK